MTSENKQRPPCLWGAQGGSRRPQHRRHRHRSSLLRPRVIFSSVFAAIFKSSLIFCSRLLTRGHFSSSESANDPPTPTPTPIQSRLIRRLGAKTQPKDERCGPGRCERGGMQIPVFSFTLKLILAVCGARASLVGGWLLLHVSQGGQAASARIYVLTEVM